MLMKVDHPTVMIGHNSHHLTRGYHPPFLGHVTSLATRRSVPTQEGKDLIIDSILNLALCKSWSQLVDDDGSVGALIDDLIQAYEDLIFPTHELQVLSGERSHGSIEHHLRGRGFNPTIATTSQIFMLIAYDTRQAHVFQKGPKYAVNFLQEILYFDYMLLMELQVGKHCSTFGTSWVIALEHLSVLYLLSTQRLLLNQYLVDRHYEVPRFTAG